MHLVLAMTDYHEPPESLSGKARDLHRALVSLREEIEAVDWYNQRVECCTDAELAGVLAHNRDEEIEHACMTIEWLRRHMPQWDAHLREFVFVNGSIREGGHADGAENGATNEAIGLNIGSLKEER